MFVTLSLNWATVAFNQGDATFFQKQTCKHSPAHTAWPNCLQNVSLFWLRSSQQAIRLSQCLWHLDNWSLSFLIPLPIKRLWHWGTGNSSSWAVSKARHCVQGWVFSREEEWGAAKVALGISPLYPVLAAPVASCAHAQHRGRALTPSPLFCWQLRPAIALSSFTRAHPHVSQLRSYSGMTPPKCMLVCVCVCVSLYFATSINCSSLI